MKRIIFILTFIIFTFSFNYQKKIIECKKKDLLIFEFEKNNTTKNNKLILKDNGKNIMVYNKNNFILATQLWLGYGSGHFDKKYSFIVNKDTMNIECECGQERNYYFKNLDFKKGNYELKFEFPKKYNADKKKYENETKYILGSKINMNNEMLNVLFKETYVPNKKPIFQNVYFKDLKFTEIDINDSINVKLKKI